MHVDQYLFNRQSMSGGEHGGEEDEYASAACQNPASAESCVETTRFVRTRLQKFSLTSLKISYSPRVL